MTAQPRYAPPPPPAPPPSMLPAWLRWVGLGCGALILLGMVAGSGIFLVVNKASAGPEATIQAFLKAAGDYAGKSVALLLCGGNAEPEFAERVRPD